MSASSCVFLVGARAIGAALGDCLPTLSWPRNIILKGITNVSAAIETALKRLAEHPQTRTEKCKRLQEKQRVGWVSELVARVQHLDTWDERN
mmetsp:Transcript_56739/g.169468  ORF Transcript_56739/g.169468 Transcript_56739/m.169468 type:complete len:92 (-) Transcript_56739:78-353(-)